MENYILDIVFATRYPDKYQLSRIKPFISFGGSPGRNINLVLAKAHAFAEKEDMWCPKMCVRSAGMLRHRIGLTYEAEAENVQSEQVIDEILKIVTVP